MHKIMQEIELLDVEFKNVSIKSLNRRGFSEKYDISEEVDEIFKKFFKNTNI